MTMHAGVAVPVYARTVYPGDDIDFSVRYAVETMPLAHPLYGNMSIRVDTFFCPWDAYYGWLHNDSVLDSSTFLNQPRFTFNPVDDVDTINLGNHLRLSSPSNFVFPYAAGANSVFDYLSYSTLPVSTEPYSAVFGGTTSEQQDQVGSPRNAEFLLSYWNVLRYYYANLHEPNMPYVKAGIIGGGAVTSVNNLGLFDVRNFDTFFNALRFYTTPHVFQDTATQGMNLFYDPLLTRILSTIANVSARTSIRSFVRGVGWSYTIPNSGLFCTCTNPDVFTRMLTVDPSAVASVNVSAGGSFSIDTLRFQNKLQQFLDSFDITGGRFSAWARRIWRVKPRRDNITPVYLGGSVSYLTFHDVLNTSASTANTSVPLGQKGSIGTASHSSRQINLKSTSYGTLIAIATISPSYHRSSYNWKEEFSPTFADTYQPYFARLGYQPVSSRQICASFNESTVGRSVAFAETMTAIDNSHGFFALGHSLQNYVFNKPIGYEPVELTSLFKDTTSPIDNTSAMSAMDDVLSESLGVSSYHYPFTINQYFAQTGPLDVNFRAYFNFGVSARRRIPSYTSPALL